MLAPVTAGTAIDGEPDPVQPSGGPPRQALALDQRAKVAVALVSAVGVCALASLWADVQQLDLINRAIDGERVTLAELQESDDRVGTTAIIYTIAYALSAAAFLLWYSRAYRNTIALGVRNPRYGTRWAVAYWFIPIISLFRPKQVVNDIWRGSDPELPPSAPSWQARPVPALLAFWWAAWLISSLISNVAMRTTFNADPLRPTPDQLQTEATAYVAADVSDVVAATLAAIVIRRITARQEERRHRSETGSLPGDQGGALGEVEPARLPA